MINFILDKFKSMGATYKTLMKVNNGELSFTKKGNVKKQKK